MDVELKIPPVGESVTEVVIGEWLHPDGSYAQQDEAVVTLETDKVNIDLPAPIDGVVTQVLKQPGDIALVGEVIGYMREAEGQKPAAEASPASAAKAAPAAAKATPAAKAAPGSGAADPHLSPSRRRALRSGSAAPAAATPARPAAPSAPTIEAEREQIVPMTPLRKRVAERLVQSQHTGAHLTTFNEVDLSAVMALRKEYQDRFVKQHGVKLGFMSFFVKAAVEALKSIPTLNAQIRGTDIVYRNYYDIGVAVGGGKGLVVPVIRHAERLGFAEIEQTISDLAKRARSNSLKLEELQGGTFTISNGGIYGSMLSTPIINPPQTGILGMHAINDRPMAVDGQVVVRPMMYVALTYDHRLVDGREAVTFLVRLKAYLENPTRILLEV